MSAKNLKKALTFSVSSALLAGTLAVGCEKPIRTSNPGPEPVETVNEGPEPEPVSKPAADAGPDAVVLPELVKPITTNPGPAPMPKPEPEPEPEQK
jgi:hypothetical protein